MENMHEALLYEKLEDGRVRCNLCAHRCLISDQRSGICRVRQNRAGVLYAVDYGRLIAAHADPIEKKPLYHFYPGSLAYSIASPGCNFRCAWCQNWDISQSSERTAKQTLPFTAPEKVVEAALGQACSSIAYTYTEPTIFFEYSLAVSKLARAGGLKNVYVSNGYMTKEMIDLYAPWLDAANIDIKAFTDEAYRKYAGAHLQPVLDACVALRQAGVWLEITTLLIPGVNDDAEQLKGLTAFIADKLGPETPWHVSRFFPQYHMTDRPATTLESIEMALEIGQAAGLLYTYAGNLHAGSATLCPQCGERLIERWGNGISTNRVAAGELCPICGARIAGVGLSSQVD